MDDLRPSASETDGRRAFTLWLIPLVFFSPVLMAGLYWDDLLLAIENYRNVDTPASIATLIGRWTEGWIEGRGRFFPISTTFSITLLSIFDFNNYFGYHLIQLGAITLCLVLFMNWFGGETRKDKAACILLLCLCAVFYPHYHDPYISYHIVMPVFCMLFFGAVHLFGLYLKKERPVYAFGALVLYLLAVSTYEVAYPLIFIFAIQLFTAKGRRIPNWLALGALFCLLVVFQIWLRSQAETMGYKGTAMGFEPIKAIRTFSIQAFSPLPFALPIGNGIRWLGDNNKGIPIESLLAGGAFLALLAFSLYILWRYWRTQTRENALLLMGLVIWLAPAALIAITVKYQGELRWGTGYIPRFLQIFGVALLMLGLLRPYLSSKVGIAVLSIGAAFVFTQNVSTIREINKDFAGARLLLNIVEDHKYLASLGCEKLHVSNVFVRDPERIAPLNEDVEIIEGSDPEEGDHVLLIHPDHWGSEWAILGRYEGGHITQPQVFFTEQHVFDTNEAKPFKDWMQAPYSEPLLDYQKAQEILTSGKLNP